MFPKSQRINLKTDFKWVVSGKRIGTKFATLFIKMAENSSPRVGIALSSKNFKKATDRNRAKRLISQVLQTTCDQLPFGINIVALPKQAILDVKSAEVRKDIEEALKREGVIPRSEATRES